MEGFVYVIEVVKTRDCCVIAVSDEKPSEEILDKIKKKNFGYDLYISKFLRNSEDCVDSYYY